VLSSGYAEPYRHADGVKFLQKPYKLDKLERVLAEVLGARATTGNRQTAQ
jgi:hypothetical protein